MRVLICGSRGWTEKQPIYNVLDALDREFRRAYPPVEVTIIHGAAKGADSIAGDLAERYGFVVEAHPANWALGRVAGIQRNLEMLHSGIDRVYAFRTEGRSRGTDHMVRIARAAGVPVQAVQGYVRKPL